MPITQTGSGTSERRGTKAAIPANLKGYLNQEQLVALQKIENFGWQLEFVRQPLFQDPIAVVISPDHQRHAVLMEDGELDMDSGLTFRH